MAARSRFRVWTTLQRDVEGDTRQYSAEFTDVLGLKEGDDVRMAGVRVGRVDKIELTDENKAHLDISVEAGQDVFAKFVGAGAVSEPDRPALHRDRGAARRAGQADRRWRAVRRS